MAPEDMSDPWDGVNGALGRFGLPAKPADRDAIIAELREQIRREDDEEGDQFLMGLLCAQLFSLGVVEDSLLVWEAKSCNFDTHLGIDVQYLCGAGLPETKAFLEATGTDDSRAALDYIVSCETGGTLRSFSVEAVLREAKEFYDLS